MPPRGIGDQSIVRVCRSSGDRGSAYFFTLVILVVLAGCDGRRSSQTMSIDAAATTIPVPAATPARPTTQEILAAPSKSLPLLSFPLIMQVPDLPNAQLHSPQWEIPRMGATGGLSVEGPAPHGDVVIQLVQLPGEHPQASIDLAEKVARKEQANNPATVFHIDFRSIGPVRVIERRAVIHAPESIMEFDKPGSLTGQTERRKIAATDFIDWSLRIYYPSSTKGKFGEGTITFSGLSKEQYDKDKEFLERLLASLKYEESKVE